MTADGVRFEDELLMFEVLNTGSVGPNLTLSPETSVTDGLLSLVIIGESHRRDLTTLLDAHSRGETCNVSLPVVHVKHVEICGPGALHIDDKVYYPQPPGSLRLRVEPGALTVLA